MNGKVKIQKLQFFKSFFIILSKPHLNNDAIIFKGNVFTFATNVKAVEAVPTLNFFKPSKKSVSNGIRNILKVNNGKNIRRYSFAKTEKQHKRSVRKIII